MAKVVKYIKVNQKLDVHFVVMRLSQLTRKCFVRDVTNQPINGSTVVSAWSLSQTPDHFISSLCLQASEYKGAGDRAKPEDR